MASEPIPDIVTRTSTKRQQESARKKKWQDRMVKQGRCRQCGASRYRSQYSQLCLTCARKKRKRQRKRQGSKKWKPGMAGRGPKQP